MPQFITISPTDIPGNKPYAWRNFLEGGYIAIGWGHTDYTDYSIDEIVEDIEAQRFRNQGEAVQSFKKLLSLKPGDVVAVNNVNHGLFGIGRIDLEYKFKTQMHDTGSENPDDFYSHYRKVKWIVTEFKTINELMLPGEKSWTRHGTMGKLEKALPPYILRELDKHIQVDYHKVEAVNKAFQSFFLQKKSRCVVSDIMPTLIAQKLFSQPSGSDFREYLRNLYTVERLSLIPYAHFDFESSSKSWYFKPWELENNQPADIELIGYEGKIQSDLREHKWIERDLTFKRNIKAKFIDIIKCQCCNTNTKNTYGINAIDFLELHHIVPLKMRKGSRNTITKESDVALICPNCHRAIHKLMSTDENLTISISEFKKYLEKQRLKVAALS